MSAYLKINIFYEGLLGGVSSDTITAVGPPKPPQALKSDALVSL